MDKTYSNMSGCDDKELLKRFLRALKQLYRFDKLLMEYKVSERAITHKLAEYLQLQFSDYNVDCEYNRVGKDQKRVDILIAKMKELGRIKCRGDCKGCRLNKCVIFPDIIVHQRGEVNNLIVVEAKTDRSTDNQSHDRNKLQALADSQEFKYRLGIAIRFHKTLEQAVESIELFPKHDTSQHELQDKVKEIWKGLG